MLTKEIIRNKRNGQILTTAEIEQFVSGMLSGSVSEAQAAALAMAIYFQGMSTEECRDLTAGLQHSGKTLDWSAMALNGPVVDKHSTGGIGDKVSLILAPLLAACGLYVPMISGRSLGHTGGTLDKLDAIPGYNSQPDIKTFQQVVTQTGCAIVGQTQELAPADKLLYSIRDLTATVESIPLITASILSKKLAAGLDYLVMDIKVGSGSFNASEADARALADSLIGISKANGLTTHAILSDMSQVLGSSVGNGLEVAEAIQFLTGDHQDSRLHEVIMSLGAELVVMAGQMDNTQKALGQLQKQLDSGAAAERFQRMVSALGGPSDLLDNRANQLHSAPCIRPFPAPIHEAAYLSEVDGRSLGNLLIQLGGGRRQVNDQLDYRVGFSDVCSVGARLEPGQPLLTIHTASDEDWQMAAARMSSIFKFSPTKTQPADTIQAIIRDSSMNSTANKQGS